MGKDMDLFADQGPSSESAEKQAAKAVATGAAPKAENRQFRVAKNIIFHLVESQAGTLGKAVGESIMNSIDAGASKVIITMDQKGFTVEDNGKGFESREEILKCFEELGFEHDDRERQFGKFGMGRSQAWAWASTVWLTNGFSFDVDIKNRGIDYFLNEGVEVHRGLKIIAKFYEGKSARDVLNTENELRQMVFYVDEEVVFNGVQISGGRKTTKWTHELPGAKLKKTDASRLAVYNQGVFVREYDASDWGVGGVLVTDTGTNLALNMARNDVLLSKCPAWKAISAELLKIAGVERVKRSGLSTDDRLFFLKQVVSGDHEKEKESAPAHSLKMLKNIDGRYVSILDINWQYRLADQAGAVKVSWAEKTSRIGRAVHSQGIAYVLDKTWLETIPGSSLKDRMERLIKESKIRESRYGRIREFVYFEDVKDCSGEMSADHKVVAEKDLTAVEIVALRAANTLSRYISGSTNDQGRPGEKADYWEYRKVYAGESETALAWTDRKSIWVSRDLLKKSLAGFAGAQRLAMVLVHEYCHDAPNATDHAHSAEFYERFEEFATGEVTSNGLANGIDAFMREVTVAARKMTKRIALSKVIDSLTVLDNIQSAQDTLRASLQQMVDKAKAEESIAADDEAVGGDASGDEKSQ